MIRRRLLLVAMQAVLAAQVVFAAGLPQPVAVSAASPSAPAASPAGGTAAGCTVVGGGGGLLSACPDVASYADFAAGLQVAMDGLKGDAATGRLSVTTDPAGATVALNGVDAGLTPLELAVPPGVYLVRISKDGFVPFSRVVQVAAGVPTTVTKSLDGADTGNDGSFNWVRPEVLIGLLGGNGFPDGSFDITGYVRDKDGADYVSFSNSKSVELKYEEPTEMSASGKWLQSEKDSVTTVGVARSADDGATWTLVKSWTGSFTGRIWTSDRFIDKDWPAGKPGSVKEHWIRAYYHEKKTEVHTIWAMVPRPEGGVAVYVMKATYHQPQELMLIWDNLTTTYCREDDGDLNACHRSPHVGRYIGSLKAPYTGQIVEQVGSTGTFKSVASRDGIARFGVTQKDLATYNLVRTSETTILDTRGGGETPMQAELFFSPTYQGSYKDADYFLGITRDCCSLDGRIYVARNGATPTLQATYQLDGDAPKGSNRSEELRIGPDGTLYILDHVRGRVYVMENGRAVLLGSVPTGTWGGIAGTGVPAYNYLSAAIDSGGNVHAAFRVGSAPAGVRDVTEAKVYYAYFPRQKVTFQSVALFTKADCPACDSARDWLKAAGIAYQENPGNLSATITASVAAAQAGAGFPVIARLGSDTVVKGGADPATISRLLGVAYPVLVDTHPARWGKTAAGRNIGLQPDWVLTVLEGDQPRIVVQRDDGVVALAPAGGAWTSTRLMAAPPQVPVVETSDSSGTTTSFNPRYPIFPGGTSTPYLATARDAPFNTITKVGDLRFLHRSDTRGGYAYTLHTTKSAPTASPYRAIESVSQLIPSTAFYVALGPNGTPGKVAGELAAYVTSQGVVTDNGYRFYRVVVDLRAQNEIATNGSIQSRAIGGAVTVDTKTKDGTADTREISLILLVENTRLRTFDPQSRAIASDITSEAVHFTGAGEKWIVTNNIALPNAIPCAGGKSLLLKASSTTTFTAEQVAASELGSCLDGLEVQPTVLTGCTSWDDARLVLAAQTIASLAYSLPLARSENVTNWELTFGSRDATVYRLVSLDQPPASAGPQCATEATGRSAAVVKVSGRFLGAGEVYAPSVSIVESGTTPVATAPTSQPDSIAFEREWLEFESVFLETNLQLAIGDEAVSSVLFLNRAGKRAGYQRQLLATRALLHCNQEGRGVAAVSRLMARTAEMPEAVRGTVACLNDFVLNPTKHWPGYNRQLWAGGDYDAAFLGTVINSSMVANPTLAWLAADGTPDASTYGQTLIDHAQTLLGKASSDPVYRDTATDFALDDYARLATAASRDAGGMGGPLMRPVLLANKAERSAIRSVVECIRSFGGQQPLAKLVELTSTREYLGGIACVDQRAGAARIERYRLLAIGLRSGTFGALYDAAGRDLDLVMSHLDLITSALSVVEAAEARYPAGTTVAAWRPDLPALDRLVIATRQLQVTADQRGRRLTMTDLAKVVAGTTECGVGLVKGLVSADGILMLASGVGAAIAGPTAALVGGVLFLGFGAVTTTVGAADLAQAWESIDLTARTAGVCGVAVSTLMTAAGAKATVVAARGWTPAELRLAPPRMIDVKTVETHGRAAGLGLDEQGAIATPRGDSIAEPAIPAARPVEPGLKAVVDALEPGRQAAALDAAHKVGYDGLTALEQNVVRTMLSRSSPANTRDLRLVGLKSGTPEYVAWDVVGGAVLDALDTSRPKSLVAGPVPAAPATGGAPALPARLAGSDAEVLAAADNAARVPPGTLAGVEEAVLARQAWLLDAVAGSERLLKALQDPGIRRLYTAEEAAALLARAKASRDRATAAFFTELSGTRLLDAFRAAVKAAQDLAGSPGKRVTALETELLTPGQNKVAVRVTVHLDGAEPVQIVMAKGNIGAAEASLYAELGPKDITQKLLTPLVENVDGNQALLITEYVPGRKPGSQGLIDLVIATQEGPYASSIGSLDARIWLRTKRPVNGQDQALFNSDLHIGNINVNEKGGSATARVVDFDNTKTFDAPEEAYWLANLLRRSPEAHDQAQAMLNYDAYLDGVVEAYAKESGSSTQAAYDMLRRSSAAMGTPAARARAEALYPSLTAEAPALWTEVINDIGRYLAKHGQSRAPSFTLTGADGPAPMPPIGWGLVVLGSLPSRSRTPGRRAAA